MSEGGAVVRRGRGNFTFGRDEDEDEKREGRWGTHDEMPRGGAGPSARQHNQRGGKNGRESQGGGGRGHDHGFERRERERERERYDRYDENAYGDDRYEYDDRRYQRRHEGKGRGYDVVKGSSRGGYRERWEYDDEYNGQGRGYVEDRPRGSRGGYRDERHMGFGRGKGKDDPPHPAGRGGYQEHRKKREQAPFWDHDDRGTKVGYARERSEQERERHKNSMERARKKEAEGWPEQLHDAFFRKREESASPVRPGHREDEVDSPPHRRESGHRGGRGKRGEEAAADKDDRPPIIERCVVTDLPQHTKEPRQGGSTSPLTFERVSKTPVKDDAPKEAAPPAATPSPTPAKQAEAEEKPVSFVISQQPAAKPSPLAALADPFKVSLPFSSSTSSSATANSSTASSSSAVPSSSPPVIAATSSTSTSSPTTSSPLDASASNPPAGSQGNEAQDEDADYTALEIYDIPGEEVLEDQILHVLLPEDVGEDEVKVRWKDEHTMYAIFHDNLTAHRVLHDIPATTLFKARPWYPKAAPAPSSDPKPRPSVEEKAEPKKDAPVPTRPRTDVRPFSRVLNIAVAGNRRIDQGLAKTSMMKGRGDSVYDKNKMRGFADGDSEEEAGEGRD